MKARKVLTLVSILAFLIFSGVALSPPRYIHHFMHALDLFDNAHSADISELSGYTGKIGSEDVEWGTGLASDTFAVPSYSAGGSVTLTKLPSLYANMASIIKGKWYASADATITNHSNASVQGSIAWIINAAAGDDITIDIPPGAYNFQDDLVVPDNVVLEVHLGASLKPASGKTLTVDKLSAGPYQIFDDASGGHFVIGSGDYVLADWFSTVDQAALASATNHIPILLQPKTYSFSQPITGASIVGSADKSRCILEYSGSGTAITVGANEHHGNYWLKPGPSASLGIRITGQGWSMDNIRVGYATTTANSANGILLSTTAGAGIEGELGSIEALYNNGYGLRMETTGSVSIPYVYSIIAKSIKLDRNGGAGLSLFGSQNIASTYWEIEGNSTGVEAGFGGDGSVGNYNWEGLLYIGNNTTTWNVATNSLLRSNIRQYNTGSASDPPATVIENALFYGRDNYCYLPTVKSIVTAPRVNVNNATGTNTVYQCQTAGSETMRQTADGDMIWGGDTRLRRPAPNQLGMGAGDAFSVEGGWSGGYLMIGSNYLWQDASGNLRVKSGTPPTSASDGNIIAVVP